MGSWQVHSRVALAEWGHQYGIIDKVREMTKIMITLIWIQKN
jgi:hypothetical protein